ncbi:hypothetical protein HGRIS_006452 [Hohenbuehelia grisea]
MRGFDFNIALTAMYLCLVIFEIPSNLLLKRFGSVTLALMIVAFGICTLATAFVTSFGGLVATRIFLGIAESGTLPGLAYILSRYYRRHEFILRVGVFLGISPSLSGAFGGLLASGLLKIDDIGSIKSWRKIFFVEGIITTIIGIICIVIIPTDPEHSRMLTAEERTLALARVDADQAVKTKGLRENISWRLMGRAFNFNAVLCTLGYTLINISFQGLSLFMPTVIATLGHFTVVQSQLRTVPPYLVGATWALTACYIGFRVKKRAAVLLCSLPMVIAGYAIAVSTKHSGARYAATFLMIAGAVPTAPLLLSWGTENAAPDTVRAVTTAIIPGVSSIGSIIAVWTYLPADAPNYHKGNSLNLATTSALWVLVAIGWLYIRWENGKRERGERDYRLKDRSPEEIEQLGYLHPHFRYQA